MGIRLHLQPFNLHQPQRIATQQHLIQNGWRSKLEEVSLTITPPPKKKSILDTNKTRSWHPSLLRNQERVWSEEQKALEERKRIDQLRRERDEERQIQEIQRLHEDSGKSASQHRARVDWMYQAPSSATGHYSEEMEGYLLGKRRIDGGLLKGDEKKAVERGSDIMAGPAAGAAPVAANSRDTMAKVMADPLFEVKKREQAAYEAMVKESVRKGKSSGGGGRERERESGRDRDRERHHRRRRSDEDSHRHSHRRSRRHRSRSPLSPERGHRSHRSRRDDRDRDYRRDDRDRRDRDRRDRRDRDDRDRDYRDSSRRRDRDERSHRRDSYHRRPSSSPRRSDSDRQRAPESNGYHRRPRDFDSRPRDSYRRDREPNGSGRDNSNGTKAQDLEEDRKRRLAEMQSNAADMEDTRRQRIADVTAMEDRQREQDDKARSERGQFVGQLHRQLQGEGLDERIKRSRGGLAVDRDED